MVVKEQQDLQYLDDDYFDREFPEVTSTGGGSHRGGGSGNEAGSGAWYDDTREKVQVEISTQTIATRGEYVH